MKCPIKHVKDDFIMWWHLHFLFEMDPNFAVWKLVTWFLSEMPHFLCPKYLKCSNFPIWKWEISKISNIKKLDISNKKHVIKLKQKKKLFDFGAFQIKIQMPSHEKILLQMLFGAFQITSRRFSRSSSVQNSVGPFRTWTKPQNRPTTILTEMGNFY